MKKSTSQIKTSRRDAMKLIAAGSAAGLIGLIDNPLSGAETQVIPLYAKGMAPVKIKSLKAIATAPAGSNLVVVKVDTTEPGLYGLGCATFTQRAE
ncbi:MAG TPA: twin-arginine translocation signal domain-containing protein, partial [Bacteroidales bacterium]|nr:twin-arginine translocation signal domain-containing protein [Bacteroidales bacterium]